MEFLTGLVLGALISGVVVFLLRPDTSGLRQDKGFDERASAPETNTGLIEKQAKGKEVNKQQLLEFFESARKVTNNDVEKLLGVSDATATRYLDELEKEGRVRQVGKTGRHVYYTSTSSVQTKG